MIESILMLLLAGVCLAGGLVLIGIGWDVGCRGFSEACFCILMWVFGATLFLLGVICILISIGFMNGDKIPYQVRYQEKCELMGGKHRSGSVYNVATKTINTSHYCKINGFEFEDIGA